MQKTPRNQPCPCGSGRKYKRCCGSPLKQSASEAKPNVSPPSISVPMAGLPGEQHWLWAVKARRGDPQPMQGAVGQPGRYRITVLLARPSYRELPETQQSFLGALKGDSHLAVTRPAMEPAEEGAVPKILAGTPEGRFEFTAIANDAGYAGKLQSEPFDALNMDDAERKGYRAIAPALSSISAHLDIPLHIEQIEVEELRTGNQKVRIENPFMRVSMFIGVPVTLGDEFCHYASLYREGLNSNSPVYRYLCFFKIIEAIRARRKRLDALSKHTVRRVGEVIPTQPSERTEWLNALFPARYNWDAFTFATIFKEEASGKKINYVVDKYLAPLRNEIAHPLLETGELAVSIDDLKHIRNINQWLPLTRCIVRRLLKNDFPEQYLTFLNEDGTISDQPVE